MLLLALDPAAETPVSDTGWAILEYDLDTIPVLRGSGVIRGGFEGFVDWLRTQPSPELITLDGITFNPSQVVCERFKLYRAGADTSPLLVEGAVRLAWPDVALQYARDKGIIPDALLKKIGWYSTDGHHRDANAAVAHGLAYLVRARHKPTIAWLFPDE